MFNPREPFFSEYSLPLFHESRCDQPFLNKCGIFLEEHFIYWFIYTLFKVDSTRLKSAIKLHSSANN